jgi:hypothetical protein
MCSGRVRDELRTIIHPGTKLCLGHVQNGHRFPRKWLTLFTIPSKSLAQSGSVSTSLERLTLCKHPLIAASVGLSMQEITSDTLPGSRSSSSRKSGPAFTGELSRELKSLYEDVIIQACAPELRSSYLGLPGAAKQKCVLALREALSSACLSQQIFQKSQQARSFSCYYLRVVLPVPSLPAVTFASPGEVHPSRISCLCQDRDGKIISSAWWGLDQHVFRASKGNVLGCQHVFAV